VNVDMMSGAVHTSWIDSLQAAFAGIQVSIEKVRTLKFQNQSLIMYPFVISDSFLIFIY
jgi:hypothetical protein